MHNWRLLILLIPSLLQPILSEHSFLYGRQYCTYSSRSSLADERFFHGKHRFGKPTSYGERLVDQRPTDRFEIRHYRYDVREVEATPLSNEQRLERRIFASDDRSPVGHIRQHRTIRDVSRNVQREIVRVENHRNFRVVRNTATSLFARLPHEDSECQGQEQSRHRFDTRLDTRRSHIRQSRQELSGRIAETNTNRKNYAITRNSRHEHTVKRQNHRDLKHQTDNVQQENANTVESLQRNIRKRNLDGNSVRDNARTEIPIVPYSERVNIRNNERSSHEEDAERARNRDIVRNSNRVHFHIKNNLDNGNDNERYSRAKVLERAPVYRDGIRQSKMKQMNNRQIISGPDTARSPLERDNRQSRGRYVIPNHQKGNTILSMDRTAEKDNERYFNRIIRVRIGSIQRFVIQSDNGQITDIRRVVNREELNRNKRDVRTDNRNENTSSRNNIRERVHSAERDMHQDVRRTKTQNVKSIGDRTDIRNAKRNARDMNRDETFYREIRQHHTRRITDKEVIPNLEERRNNAKYERTGNRNSERYSRDIDSYRSISLDREVRKSDTRKVLDIIIARSRSEQNTNVRVERIRTRNDERLSREHIRERAISDDRDVRKTESKRVSDVRSREARSREELNTSVRDDGINIRNINRNSRGNVLIKRSILRSDIVSNREKHNRNVQNVRSDIRKRERHSREKDFDAREILRSNIRRITDENDVRSHTVRNVRTRVESADVRYAERYEKDNIRERTLSLKRDIRQHDKQRMTDRRLIRSQNEHHERTDIRYSYDNARDRSVSMDREVRESNLRRVSDLQIHRNREERIIRNKRPDIGNYERYTRDVTHERVMLMGQSEDDRQLRTARIGNRQVTRRSEVQNINVRKERNNVRYARNLIRDQTDREDRKINGRRILRSHITLNDVDKRSNSRHREHDFRDFTHEMDAVTVERNTIADNRKLRDLGHLTSYERRTGRDQIGNRISQEQIRKRDNLRSSNARVSESRRVIAIRTSDLYRERETGINDEYRNSHNVDMRRDYVSRQNSELTNALRTTSRMEQTDSSLKPTENPFNALFYWQYFFYAVQGIYILGVLIQVFKEKEPSKTSSMAWLTPTRLVKVD